MMDIKILILFFLLSNSVYATINYSLGFGTITHNFKRVQTDTAGDKTQSFSFTPTLFLGLNIPFPLMGRTNFNPAIGYAKFSNGADGQTKNEIILQYHLSSNLTNWFNFNYGFSNFLTQIGGNGASVSLNNGQSTSTFYIPSQTKTSYTSSLDIAGEFIITNHWNFKIQLAIERFLSSDRRSIAHLIAFNFKY